MVRAIIKILFVLQIPILNLFGSEVIFELLKGQAELRSKNEGFKACRSKTKLKDLDIIRTHIGSVSGFKFSDESFIEVGEGTTVMLDRNDRSGWNKVFILKGSLRVMASRQCVVKTPTSEIIAFTGMTDVHVEQGGAIVVPRSGQGAMVYCEDRVEGVSLGSYGFINQKSHFEIQNTSKIDYKFLVGEKLSQKISGARAVRSKYRQDLFEFLNIQWKPDSEVILPTEVNDILDHKLNFKTEIYALESSADIYDHYVGQSQFLKEGRELLFAQQLFESQDAQHLIPHSLRKHFVNNEVVKHFFYKIDKADNALNKLSPIQKNFVIYFFRQQFIEDLVPKHHFRDGFGFRFREILVHNSNVTQTPDGQNTVSDKDGLSLNSQLKLSYTGRERLIGRPSFELQLTDLGYFKKAFQTREYSTISLELKNKFKFKRKAKLNAFTPILNVQSTYLNTSSGKYYAFTTYQPKFDIIFKPLKNLGSISDITLIFTSLGLELRKYSGGDSKEKDLAGNRKDTNAPNFTLFLLSMKKWSNYLSKTTLAFNYKLNDSDSPELDYDNLRIDFAYEIPMEVWTIIPSYAYSYRDQDSYAGAAREDKTHEVGFTVKRKIFNDEGGFGLSYRYIDQKSNQSSFVYQNDQVSANFSYQF